MTNLEINHFYGDYKIQEGDEKLWSVAFNDDKFLPLLQSFQVPHLNIFQSLASTIMKETNKVRPIQIFSGRVSDPSSIIAINSFQLLRAIKIHCDVGALPYFNLFCASSSSSSSSSLLPSQLRIFYLLSEERKNPDIRPNVAPLFSSLSRCQIEQATLNDSHSSIFCGSLSEAEIVALSSIQSLKYLMIRSGCKKQIFDNANFFAIQLLAKFADVVANTRILFIL